MRVARPLVVLDTNVFVSGLLRHSSVPRALLELLRAEVFAVAMSPPLLGELVDVISRPSLQRLISREAAEALLDNLRADARIVEPSVRPHVVQADPDDDDLFACALAAGASWIVSGDKAVLGVNRFRSIRVGSPTEFLSWLSARAQRAGR